MDDVFTMPIMESLTTDPQAFVWAPTDDQQRRAHLNHGQSLEQLRDRGGVNWIELRLILLDLPWSSPAMSLLNSKAVCLELYPQSS